MGNYRKGMPITRDDSPSNWGNDDRRSEGRFFSDTSVKKEVSEASEVKKALEEKEREAKKLDDLGNSLRKLANKFPVELGRVVQFLDYKKRNWCEHPDASEFMTLLPEEVTTLLEESGEGFFFHVVAKELLMATDWGMKEEFKLKVEED